MLGICCIYLISTEVGRHANLLYNTGHQVQQALLLSWVSRFTSTLYTRTPTRIARAVFWNALVAMQLIVCSLLNEITILLLHFADSAVHMLDRSTGGRGPGVVTNYRAGVSAIHIETDSHECTR